MPDPTTFGRWLRRASKRMIEPMGRRRCQEPVDGHNNLIAKYATAGVAGSGDQERPRQRESLLTRRKPRQGTDPPTALHLNPQHPRPTSCCIRDGLSTRVSARMSRPKTGAMIE